MDIVSHTADMSMQAAVEELFHITKVMERYKCTSHVYMYSPTSDV